eukprot:11940997-Alexandrium_andersonii.AAC.1
MSASLVGSEMCIRDRRAPLRGHPRGSLGRRRRLRHGRALGALGDLSGTCLLYTSDAADDM